MATIKLKNIVMEDFVNYKMPSMFLVSSVCNWKCCIEQNMDIGVCQNAPLVQQATKEISIEYIYNQFVNNPITKAIVIGGLEPMLQIDEILSLIKYFRQHNEQSMFVIYTGYYPNEIANELFKLKKLNNIIVKFGRYVPNDKPTYDKVLGINLASSNQYAEVIC